MGRTSARLSTVLPPTVLPHGRQGGERDGESRGPAVHDRGSPTTAVGRVVGMVGVCRGVVVGLTREALLASRGPWSDPSFTPRMNIPPHGYVAEPAKGGKRYQPKGGDLLPGVDGQALFYALMLSTSPRRRPLER